MVVESENVFIFLQPFAAFQSLNLIEVIPHALFPPVAPLVNYPPRFSFSTPNEREDELRLS